MVFKVSLSLALLLYLLESLLGVPFEKSLMASLFYFIIFYSLMFGFHILYLNIKLRMRKLEEQRREEEKRKQKAKKREQAADTLAKFIREANLT